MARRSHLPSLCWPILRTTISTTRVTCRPLIPLPVPLYLNARHSRITTTPSNGIRVLQLPFAVTGAALVTQPGAVPSSPLHDRLARIPSTTRRATGDPRGHPIPPPGLRLPHAVNTTRITSGLPNGHGGDFPSPTPPSSPSLPPRAAPPSSAGPMPCCSTSLAADTTPRARFHVLGIPPRAVLLVAHPRPLPASLESRTTSPTTTRWHHERAVRTTCASDVQPHLAPTAPGDSKEAWERRSVFFLRSRHTPPVARRSPTFDILIPSDHMGLSPGVSPTQSGGERKLRRPQPPSPWSTVRPRVTSAVRRSALGWTQHNIKAPTTSADLKKNHTTKGSR
ncbi:hypothetical protein B0H14DRAFT_3489672 [Mycena olivaceomarginata]|nr:hypothetical protein B0H14DRAFT_3489672 [Mycena olivaceomarginata]